MIGPMMVVMTDIMIIVVTRNESRIFKEEAAYVTAKVVVSLIIDETPKIAESLFENFNILPASVPLRNFESISPKIKLMRIMFLGSKLNNIFRSISMPTIKKNIGTKKPYPMV